MKKQIKDFDLKGKKVIIRCDFNVPMEDGKITDNTRIKSSLKTIRYAVNHGGKVILLSHLGRIKEDRDKEKYSLKLVSDELSKLLKKKVKFINKTKGKEVENAVKQMKEKEIILLENTRFEDLDGKKESQNDKELGKYWANLGDIFINDAFGTIHRNHASNVGIASNLPSGLGMLVNKEIKVLNKLLKNPKKPYVIVLGGAKVSDKLDLIKNLVKKADYILIGGGMAFTFLKAAGFSIGSSLLEKDKLSECQKLLDEYPEKIILPIDIITSDKISNDAKTHLRFINEIEEDEMGLDIGVGTIKVFKQYLEDSKTIFWNGPMGCFEYKPFEEGTKSLCEIIANTDAYKVIGGGDTISAVTKFGFEDKMDHLSTGGGASLTYLEGKKLEALDIIDEKE